MDSQTQLELSRICNNIADELELLYNGDLYDNDGEYVDGNDADGIGEPISVCDYLSDTLEIQIKGLSSDGHEYEYEGCRIAVTLGGPAIYIDTCTERIEGYWWGDSYFVSMPRRIVDMIDDEIRELYGIQ
jgi:hypothetical protein